MKKFLSLLGIVLILATLLVTFSSCGVEYYVPADNTEVEQTVTTQNFPMTELTKRMIYDSAMTALREGRQTGDWLAAYNYFLQIPDYADVPEYLARFYYQTGSTMIYDVTDTSEDPSGKQHSTHTTKYNNYGYITSSTIEVHQDGLYGGAIRVNSLKTDAVYNRPVEVMYPNNYPSIYKPNLSPYTLEHQYVTLTKEVNGQLVPVDTSLIAKTTISMLLSNFEIRYTYNENRSLNKMNVVWKESQNLYNSEYEYRYEYDENGRLSQIKLANVTQAEGIDSTECLYADYKYNDAGQLISVTYPIGIIDILQNTLFWIDTSKGQTLYNWTAPVWDEANACSITYEYNDLGLLAKETLNYENSDDKDEVTTYDAYDENGNVTQKTVTFNTLVTVGEETQIESKSFRFIYDVIILYYDPLA